MGRHARAREARVTRPRLGRVLLPAPPARVDPARHVVDDPAVARPVGDRRDVHVVRQVASGSRSTGRCRPPSPAPRTARPSPGRRRACPERQPSAAGFGADRSGTGSPSGAPASAQATIRRDLGVRQRPVVLELRPDARLGLPRRHRPRRRRPPRCPRPASSPVHRCRARTAPPGPSGGTPGTAVSSTGATSVRVGRVSIFRSRGGAITLIRHDNCRGEQHGGVPALFRERHRPPSSSRVVVKEISPNVHTSIRSVETIRADWWGSVDVRLTAPETRRAANER